MLSNPGMAFADDMKDTISSVNAQLMKGSTYISGAASEVAQISKLPRDAPLIDLLDQYIKIFNNTGSDVFQ